MTNRDDWAVVVGIVEYPRWGDLKDLAGAERDAKAFHDWVIDPAGGAVPSNQALLCVTSQFKPFEPPHNEAPSRDLVERRLQQLAESNGDGKVGRRLYLYISCHGFSPPEPNQVACLTADASSGFPKNVHANHWADLFYQRGLFDETVLFADCCRTSIRQAPVIGSGAAQIQNKAGIEHRKRFYGFAAKMAQETMEVPDESGHKRGVFTMALIDGLRGKAAEYGTETVSSASLKRFLEEFTNDYLPSELSDQASKINPDIEDNSDSNEPIVFCSLAGGKPTIDIDLQFETNVADGTDAAVLVSKASHPEVVTIEKVHDNGCKLKLACGHYMVVVGDQAHKLTVSPTNKWELEHV
ncbi:MAG: caspase family protein [Pseudomonadota bacterium]